LIEHAGSRELKEAVNGWKTSFEEYRAAYSGIWTNKTTTLDATLWSKFDVYGLGLALLLFIVADPTCPHDLFYPLVASMIHWNPDKRLDATAAKARWDALVASSKRL
jgi:hypothetical protein